MLMSANPSARSAVLYLTVGALTDVWASVWWRYLRVHEDQSSPKWYVCTGLLVTGLVLVVIGLLIGRIGREARHADAPPAPAADAQAIANARMANVNAAAAAQMPIGTAV
jgi:hypothetical protein